MTGTIKNDPFTVYTWTINGDVPTTTEIKNFFESLSSLAGSGCVNFINSSGYTRSTLFYSAASKNYCAGIITSYFSSRFYKVINNAMTITMTAF